MAIKLKTLTAGMLLSAGLAAGLVAGGVQSASAATYAYDFKAAANAGGGVGESIFSTFSTSTSSGAFAGFAGANLDITASATGDDDSAQFVYFDNGGAGIGVCKDPTAGASVGAYTNGGANSCDPSSDDGITSIDEVLTFTATDTAVRIESIWMNANHDSADVRDAIYTINGVTYGTADMTTHSLSGSGDVRIDLGFTLNAGDWFSIAPVQGGRPDSYISGIALAAVPVPASGLLLTAGLAGLGALRRRRKAA